MYFFIPSKYCLLQPGLKHKTLLTLSVPSIGYGADKKKNLLFFEIQVSNAKYIRFLVDISSFRRDKIHLFLMTRRG